MEEPVETHLPPIYATALLDLPDTDVKSAEIFAWKSHVKTVDIAKVSKIAILVFTATVFLEHGVIDARKMSMNATPTHV